MKKIKGYHCNAITLEPYERDHAVIVGTCTDGCVHYNKFQLQLDIVF